MEIVFGDSKLIPFKMPDYLTKHYNVVGNFVVSGAF
jgi:hypothetical protein